MKNNVMAESMGLDTEEAHLRALSAALDFLYKTLEEKPMTTLICRKCGYDAFLLTEKICPKCGSDKTEYLRAPKLNHVAVDDKTERHWRDNERASAEDYALQGYSPGGYPLRRY